MAKLATITAETQKLFLPSTEKLPEADKAWVVLRLGKTLGADIADIDDFKGQGKLTLGMLAGRILEWNFEEDDGTAVPISFDSVKRMEPEDIGFLLEKIGANSKSNTASALADPKENAPLSVI